MPYDDVLAARVRRVLASRDDVEEKHMFGGVAFLVREPHVREMDFTGRPLKGFLYVEPDAVTTPAPLRRWVDRGVAYADGLPPKRARPRARRR